MFNLNTCQDCYVDPLTNDFDYCGPLYTLKGYEIKGTITSNLRLQTFHYQQMTSHHHIGHGQLKTILNEPFGPPSLEQIEILDMNKIPHYLITSCIKI